MANGLNTSFQLDPERFLSTRKSIDTAKTQHGKGYQINGKGITSLNMVEYSPSQVAVHPASTGIGSFFNQSPIRAYYLVSEFDKEHSMVIGSECDYFFTDLITGCQFMAYGNSRHELTVCHLNALTEGQPRYDRAAAEVRRRGYPIEFIYGPRHYRANLPVDEGPHSVVTVIGWRKADGWHFYSRQCVNAENKRYVVGTSATELLPARRR